MMFWVGLFLGTLFGLILACIVTTAHNADIEAERWYYEQEQKHEQQSERNDVKKYRL